MRGNEKYRWPLIQYVGVGIGASPSRTYLRALGDWLKFEVSHSPIVFSSNLKDMGFLENYSNASAHKFR